MHQSDKPKIISLFSGSGGLDLGFEQAGFEIVAAYDMFKSAVKTYNFNRSSSIAQLGDVTSLTGKTISNDIRENGFHRHPIGVIGGPPCQAFSRSNVYPKNDDIRRTLPGHFARLLKELKSIHPVSFFVFENVQGLTFKRHKEEFARFRFLFEDAGFQLHETLLNARQYGIAQDRPRVFIVGLNQDLLLSLQSDFSFPVPVSEEITVKEAFTEAFGQQAWPAPAFFKKGIKSEDIPFHPNHWTMMPKSPKFHNGSLQEGEIKGRSFRVLAWDKPSWTVAYGHREIHIHPSGKRRLSIFEAMALQGFPRDYVLHGTLSDQVKLVSDAVPPPLAKHIAQAILAFLNNNQLIEADSMTHHAFNPIFE